MNNQRSENLTLSRRLFHEELKFRPISIVLNLNIWDSRPQPSPILKGMIDMYDASEKGSTKEICLLYS